MAKLLCLKNGKHFKPILNPSIYRIGESEHYRSGIMLSQGKNRGDASSKSEFWLLKIAFRVNFGPEFTQLTDMLNQSAMAQKPNILSAPFLVVNIIVNGLFLCKHVLR